MEQFSSSTFPIGDLAIDLDDYFGLASDLDSFFTTPRPSCMPETSESNILSQANFFSTSPESSSNGTVSLLDVIRVDEDPVLELSTSSASSRPSDSFISQAMETQSLQDSLAIQSPCGCMAQALSLMTQLLPNSWEASTLSETRNVSGTATPPTIQAVIAKNEATIEAVSIMLECTCSQDGYLLAIISLIVFKVLGWYAAAARKMLLDDDNFPRPRSSHSQFMSRSEQISQDPAVIGNYYLGGEDSARMAAQLVLSELHRVRRLLTQLSSKLKVKTPTAKIGNIFVGGKETPGSSGSGSGESGRASRNGSHVDAEATLPLSAKILEQLEVDLKKQLKALSSEIVEGLRSI